jgi:dTDP-4-amino-4,6-dideoxygalactose transaminase
MQDRHPDEAWLLHVSKQLSEWLALGSNGAGGTSQITGAGAVQAAERLFSAMHESRPSVMVPCGTYGMRCALAAAGVTAGCEVVIPGFDWLSNRAAVLSLSAIPVVARVAEDTFTLDPQDLPRRLTKRTKAVIVTHLHGVMADMEAIKRIAEGAGLAVIEDCAQALGCEYSGRPAGAFSDFSVFSFGPNKSLDIGEGGMISARDWALFERLIRECAHPARQAVEGVVPANFNALSLRPHPLSAVLLAVQLEKWDREAMLRRHEAVAARLRAIDGLHVIGNGSPAKNSSAWIPLRAEDPKILLRQDGLRCVRSGAWEIEGLRAGNRGVWLARWEEAYNGHVE